MWWQQPGLLEGWLDDFLADALQRRGLGDLLCDPQMAVTDLLSDPRHFGMGSLDMVQLASRFAHCLGIDRTGLSDLLLARRSAEGWLGVARRSLAIDDSRLRFYSSGSTGAPTACEHTLSHLQREVQTFCNLLPQPARVVCAVPGHHIYGFIWGTLLPAMQGCERLRLNVAQSLPSSWAPQLRDDDMIVATPDLWTMIVEQNVSLPGSFIGISSTAPLPASTAATIRQQYPQALLAQIYGSSETAGLAWRTENNAAFKVLPYWSIAEKNGDWLLTDRDTKDQFTLNDRLSLDAKGDIKLLGRADSVVQINGNNINLERLAALLERHPEVADARVIFRQHALHYFLVPQPKPADLRGWCQQFSSWLTTALGNVPAPQSVVVADALPRSALNKVVSWTPESYPSVTGCFRGEA